MLMRKTQGDASYVSISFTTQNVHRTGHPNAFYLTPLSTPKEDVWYSRAPLGHNTLSKIVNEMMAQAGFEGYYTNHSLRVSSATRLFNAEVDEQLIMSRTGHSSTSGVRAYKRTSEKLKLMTSDLLSKSTPTPGTEPPKAKRPCAEGKENVIPPTLQITGGSNITIP